MNRRIRWFLIIGLLLWVLMWVLINMLMPVGGSSRMMVRIPKGASATEVGRILKEHRVIRSALGFRILAKITRKSGHLKPGVYGFTSSMSPITLLNKISIGEVSAKWITFPEGYTIKQMSELLESQGAGSAERFAQLALSDGDKFALSFTHPGKSLEGFLFPDTYLIALGESEEEIISEMLQCFQRKVIASLGEELKKSDLSLNDIIILASLIEREARTDEDRILVSAVIHNRLKKGMRLEVDATVLYALGYHKDRVLYDDLRIDSSYNTYRHKGLPPGPIANPGLKAIDAALNPANVDYLYYVAKSDGSHIFSRTFQEHQNARETVRSLNGH